MSEKLKRMVTFWDGIRTERGILLMGGLDSQKDTDHTVVTLLLTESTRDVWTNEWKARVLLPAGRTSVTPVIVGVDGEVCEVTRDGLVEERPIDIHSRPDKFGALLGGSVIDDTHIVVGYGNQVYQREARDRWTPIDGGLPGKEEVSRRVFGLESIDGWSLSELYAVGLQGTIWLRRTGEWKSVASPTNVRLTSVHCADDGAVYACGLHGVVLKGTGETWDLVSADPDLPSFWDVSSLGDEIFLASTHVLYHLVEGKVEPVDLADHDFGEAGIPTSFFRLSKAGGKLLSVGEKDVIEFANGSWRPIV